MKKYISLISCCVVVGCWPRPEPVSTRASTTRFVPNMLSRQLLENSVQLKLPRPIQNAGKIYVNGDYIFVNDQYKGVHIIQNKDPKKPVKLGFISIPGCIDIAVKGTTMYADNAVDLVVINMADSGRINVSKRYKNIFKEPTAPDGGSYAKSSAEKDAIITGWSQK